MPPLAAFVGALVALLVYHLAVVRPSMARTASPARAPRRPDLRRERRKRRGASWRARRWRSARLDSGAARIATIASRSSKRWLQTDLSRAGFVRYDAFADSGVAGFRTRSRLLNRQGDGVVLTSIYSRSDTRTFGKPVAGFKPTVQASAEELEAIERARAPES